MPDEVTIKVEGVEKLTATLAKAAEDLEDLQAANAKVAAIIESAARARAPRRSGALAGSIRGSTAKGKAVLDVTAAYAGPIHWGWPSRNIGAQPFAMEAARNTEPQWTSIIEDAVNKALDQVKGA